jgi:hypothetical protein
LRVKERVKTEGDFTDNSKISIYLVDIRRVLYHKNKKRAMHAKEKKISLTG